MNFTQTFILFFVTLAVAIPAAQHPRAHHVVPMSSFSSPRSFAAGTYVGTINYMTITVARVDPACEITQANLAATTAP